MPPAKPQLKIRKGATQQLAELEAQKAEQNKPQYTLRQLIDTYLIPILVLGLFGLVIFNMIIPNIQGIFTQLDQVNEIKSKTEKLTTKLIDLQLLTTNIVFINSQLDQLNRLVPEGVTTVVGIQSVLVETATRKYGLTVKEAKSSEQPYVSNVSGNSADNTKRSVLLEIPTTIKATGSLSNIKAFIAEIRTLPQFFTISALSINGGVDSAIPEYRQDGKWNLEITILRYQFQPAQDLAAQAAAYEQFTDFATTLNANLLQTLDRLQFNIQNTPQQQ
jgi:Tfp pilus assembly protein PilO